MAWPSAYPCSPLPATVDTKPAKQRIHCHTIAHRSDTMSIRKVDGVCNVINTQSTGTTGFRGNISVLSSNCCDFQISRIHGHGLKTKTNRFSSPDLIIDNHRSELRWKRLVQ